MDENKITKVDTESNNSNKNSDQQEKPKHKFKMPSSLMIIIGVLFFVIVLTWILDLAGASAEIPGTLPGSTTTVQVQAAGLLSFGNAITGGFINAGSLILYLFVLGGFIELIMRTGSLEQGIKSLVLRLNGKEIILIPLLFLIFSLGGTIYGMQEETVGFFILIVPFLIIAGFDAMTGLLVILLGTTTGFAASTVNPFAIGVAVDAVPGSISGLTVGTALGARFVIWILFTLIGMAFVTSYAYYVQKSPEKSFVAKDHDKNLEWAQANFTSVDANEHRKTTKREMIGLSLFFLSFIIMVAMYIPWGSFFAGYDGHVAGSGWVYPNGAGWLFNGMSYPGYWYFGELVTEFLIFAFAIGYTFKMSTAEISDAMWKGAKDILPVAIIIGTARAIPLVMQASYMDVWIVSVLTKGLPSGTFGFLIVIFLVFLVLACFIPSTSGLANLAIPIIGLTVASIFTGGGQDVQMMAYTIIMFSIAAGIINMFIPTQAIVLASAEASHVPYNKMLKPVLVYAGIISLITIVVVAPTLGALAAV